MKKLGMVFSLEGVELADKQKNREVVDLSAEIIRNVIIIWGNQKQRGLGEEDRRKYYKISDVLDIAVKEHKTEIELEDDLMGLVKKAFREVILTPDTLLRQVEILVADVKDR